MATTRLPTLSIAEPCHEDWSAMEGDERARHCQRCDKRVHDLGEMTRAEAEALLGEGPKPCVRFSRADDGRVVTRTTQQERLLSLLGALASKAKGQEP